MKELEYWGLLGKTSLVFGDDNLTLDKKRIRKLCELMQRSRYRFQIETAGVRIDNVDYETLRIMKDVGFNYLSFGIESGSDRVLKEIRKGITLNQIHRTLEMSCKLNFDVKLYFIINNRTETYKEAQQSFSLSRQYPISLARFTNLCPFPGTYDYEWILKHGKLLYSPEDYLNNPNEFIHRPIYDGPGMSMEEREQVIKDAKTELMRLEKTRITASANNSIIHKSTANNNVCKKNDNIKGMHPLQKILFVNHNLFPFEISGTPLSTLNHALGITQRGLEVAVLIPNREVKEGFKKERIKDFTIYQIPALDKFEAYFAKAGEDKLSGYRNTIDCIIDDFSPQIVHINDYVYMPAEIIEIFSRRGCIVVRNVCNCEELCHRDYPVISSGLKGKLCPGPSSSEICANCFAAYLSAVPHQGISMELSRTIEENIKYRFEYIKRLYKDVVDKVIFTSEPFRTYFPRFVPIPEEKVIVIPRGFKFDFARKVNKRENIDGVVHFAFIGNIMFSKGIDVVLQAFETVCKAHNFVLHIYGSLVNHEYLNWIKKLQTEYPDKFIYHGQFKEHDLPKIASNIDLCIIPSYFDTYNRVLREFLYLGIPVIVTDFFGAFIVEDGKNGLKIPTGDADTLAEKMIDIIRKPFMIEHLSHGAAQTQIPSLEEETDKLIKTYNDLYNHTTETNKAGLDKMITSNGERRPSAHRSARLIAFYLPQYHPIPENDQWWGKGFTEWTNVAKARPLFSGHYQPHIPADLGFYDLRLPETRESQAELARRYGISGFCYYHYWFNGKRLLNRVFDEVLDSGKPDFPFCLCWANENWTRAWDGRQGEILIKQNYCEEDDQNHIRWLLNIFKDKRYIRIDSKPLMLVYLSKSIPDPAKSMQIWREEAKKIGEELYLCKVESAPWEYGDPGLMGFDACVEFQPDWGNLGPVKTQLSNGHVVYDYAKFVDRMLNKPVPSYKRFPCVTPMWDNSPRRKQAALIIDNSTPEKYERWLRSVIGKLESFNLDDNIVFINAWNEWGEGNHLEPDEKNGTAYLEATQNALPKTPHQARELNQGLVSIVILTFNQLEYTKQCVKSIKEYTPETHEIIFVDNGSTDGTVQWLRTLTQAIENFKLIENGRNLGFAKGCNQGIEASQGAYILLLNNDVVVTQGWLSEMLKCINSTDNIGMVGPMSNAVSGPQLVQKVPYGNSMKAMQKFARDFAAENSGKTSEIMRLVGFCLLIRKEVFDIIGGLDENYISGNYEDDDLCLHSYIAGYRNIIAQDVFIHHYGSMTFKGNAIDYQATMQDNLQYFAGKWKDLVEVSGNGYRVGFTKKQQLKKLLEWGKRGSPRGMFTLR